MKTIPLYIAVNELGEFDTSGFRSEAIDRLLDTYGAKTVRIVRKEILIADEEGELMSDRQLKQELAD